MKSFWKYFTITVLLLLGLCCAGILYMFFVGGPLFKFKYISYNKNYFSQGYKIAGENAVAVNTVSLTSENFDVNVAETDGDEIYLGIHNGVFGFALVSNSNLSLSDDFVSGDLSFDVVEPHGFTTKGSSVVTLFLPKNFECNLVLNNAKANTNIDLPTASITNLTYSTTAGNLNLKNAKVLGEMDLSLGRATFSVGGEVETENNKINLSMTSGCFNCGLKDFSTINILKSTSGVVRANSCINLNGKNENAGGSISIGRVENVNLVGGDTNVGIDELNFGTIDIKKSGNVAIGMVENSSRINTATGKIEIATAKAFELFLNSQSGEIAVGDSFGHVDATTKTGDIYVNFNDKAAHFNDEISARRLFAVTETGEIVAYGVENTEIKIKGKGSASIYMDNVLGSNNLVDVGTGSVYIQIKEETLATAPTGIAHYRLYWKTTSGSVSVNLANTHPLGTGGDRDKEKEIYVNDSKHETENSLNITSSTGSIKVRDSITRNY